MSENKLTVGELVYKISGDMDNLRTELKRSDAEVKKLRDSIEKNDKATKSNTASVFKGIAAYDIFRRALDYVRQALRFSLNSAVDLGESINAVNVVFAEGAEQINEYGKTASRSVGLARSEFNQMATLTGALLKDTGLTMQEVADQTIMLTERAADMASVFNTDVADAASAINQAIRGETEAIRRYAGDVTDATLQTYLQTQGINKQVTALSEQEKRLYRVQVIMKQTEVTAGDFANTSDSLANQQRIISARIKDTAAAFGQSLIPSVKNILKEFVNTEDTTKDTSEAFDDFGRVLYRVSNIVIVLMKTISNLAAATKIAWNGVQNTFIGGATLILKTMQVTANALGKDTQTIDTALSNLAESAASNIDDVSDAFETMKDNSESINNALEQVFNPTKYKPIEETSAAISSVAAASNQAAESTEEAGKKLTEFQDKMLGFISDAQKTRKSLEDDLAQSFKSFGDSIKGNVQETVSSLAQIVVGAEDQIKSLKEQLRNSDDSEERKSLRDQIKQQEEILDAREEFEERQSERIAAIRQKLSEAGIDAAEAGLDKVLSVRSLEEEIEEQRRVASLDEFTRFEEQQSRKLILLTDAFITETTLLQEKIATQKSYEADLTAYLASEDSKRLENTEVWAQATIDKYQEVAKSLQNLLSTQGQIKNLQVGSVSPVSPSSVVQNGRATTTPQNSTTNNNTNISAPVTINGQNVNNLSAKEISAIMGFELNKFIR